VLMLGGSTVLVASAAASIVAMTRAVVSLRRPAPPRQPVVARRPQHREFEAEWRSA
jgi:hypothetical protein